MTIELHNYILSKQRLVQVDSHFRSFSATATGTKMNRYVILSHFTKVIK